MSGASTTPDGVTVTVSEAKGEQAERMGGIWRKIAAGQNSVWTSTVASSGLVAIGATETVPVEVPLHRLRLAVDALERAERGQ